MMEPPSPSYIRWPISAVSRNGPLKFTPITLSNSSSEVCADDGASGDMPALLTRMSTAPKCA